VTADKVVDASAICAIIFNEPGQASAQSKLRGARTLYAPSLIEFEVANVLLKKLRAQPADRAQTLKLYANFKTFTIRKPDVDLLEAALLGEHFKISLYDASYLWLARHLGAELVTLDSGLAKAAAKP